MLERDATQMSLFIWPLQREMQRGIVISFSLKSVKEASTRRPPLAAELNSGLSLQAEKYTARSRRLNPQLDRHRCCALASQRRNFDITDIAMNDSLRVGVLQTLRNLNDARHSVLDRYRAVLFDEYRKITAFNILPDQNMRSTSFVGIVGGHHIGMPQPDSCLVLSQKSPQCIGGLYDRRRHDLQSHKAFESPMLGLQDNSHPALVEFIKHYVIAPH